MYILLRYTTRDSPTVWPLCAFFFILLQFYVPFYVKKKKIDNLMCLLEFECAKRLKAHSRAIPAPHLIIVHNQQNCLMYDGEGGSQNIVRGVKLSLWYIDPRVKISYDILTLGSIYVGGSKYHLTPAPSHYPNKCWISSLYCLTHPAG